jgi:hypothetical protein
MMEASLRERAEMRNKKMDGGKCGTENIHVRSA